MPQNVNLNDTTPAAPAGSRNVKWQGDAPSSDPTVIRNGSAYMPPFGASGASHAPGLVPDPGIVGNAVKFLREDAVWAQAAISILLDVLLSAPANGDVLTYESATSLWKNKQPAASTGFNGINSQSGTTYTLASTDNAKLVRFTGSAAVTATLPAASASIARVQSASSTAASQAISKSQAFASNNAAGNFLVCAVRNFKIGGAAGMTVSDSLGNTWVQAAGGLSQVNSNAGTDVSLWYCENCRGGANTVTATAAVSTTFIGLAIAEYSGMALSSSFDVDATASSGSSSNTAFNSGSATTTAIDLLLGYIQNEDNNTETYTPSGSWNVVTHPDGNLFLYDQLNMAAGSYSFSGTLSATARWTAMLYAFKGSTTGSALAANWNAILSNDTTSTLTISSGAQINGSLGSIILQPGERVFIASDGTNYFTDALPALGPRSAKVITTAYTASLADHAIFASAAAAYAITLPDATKYIGELVIKKTDANVNAITATPVSAQTIDGAATFALSAQWKYIRLMPSGGNWMNVGSN